MYKTTRFLRQSDLVYKLYRDRFGYGIDLLEGNWSRPREYCQFLGACRAFKESGSVLDLGSGDPSRFPFALMLSDYYETHAQDIWFGEHLADYDKYKINFILRSIDHIPLESESVDIVTSISVLEHLCISVLSAALKEAFRVLKPGGLLLMTLDVTNDYRQEISPWNYLELEANKRGVHCGEPDGIRIIAKERFDAWRYLCLLHEAGFEIPAMNLLCPDDMLIEPSSNLRILYICAEKPVGG